MPIYVYACPGCGIELEELRAASKADDPLICPICSSECSREVTTFSIGSVAKDKAENAPRKTAHRAGCPCCTPRTPSKAGKKTTSGEASS